MILDQGIIQFNAKPKDGVAFLVKNKVITDDPLDIAKFLASTDKLDKHVLGNFLGKDNDYSIAVLNRFASLFHYEGVPFDLALRAFTNRFAMPGESQMIYRILERFSVYYSQSNAHVDKDKALILSYALIMLNVDLHSVRVKAKMTKEEFVRNTEPALGGAVSRSELEDMYMRILSKELKPETSAEEVVYSKLAVNPKYSTKAKIGMELSGFEDRLEILKKGAFFLKYGREGTPHVRKVFLSADGKKLCWIDPKKLERMQKRSGGSARRTDCNSWICKSGVSGDKEGVETLAPTAPEIQPSSLDLVRSSFVKLRARGVVWRPESFRREIPTEDITGLVVGTGGTRNFRRHFAGSKIEVDAETEQRCFSLITDYRTLDLHAPPNVDIGPYLLFFHAVLSDREKRLRAAADKNKDIWTFTQRERASLVRWQELVPEWSAHWNCGARVSAGGGYRASQHPKEELLNHRMFLVNPSGFVLDRGQRLETAISPQLVALWLEGIPSSVRPRIWPIASGNGLRMDENLFASLLEPAASVHPLLERELKSSSMRKFSNRALAWIDARGSREQQAFFKSTVRRSFSVLPDLAQTEEVSEVQSEGGGWSSKSSSCSESAPPMNGGWENVSKATRVLVLAFLTQRKDIKYTQGMAQLGAMVILNVGIQDLSRAFLVYSNILHQHYFFDFFTMRWRDMRMRFDLFSKLMRERMPYLDDHFSAIQITSDLYFNQWMLTGFTRVLPFRTACRVWDGFLLLGESYFFTAALALLNYYEHSLMTSGFSGCLEILLGHADEVLFNDKKFFDCVHFQSVSNERFAAWISAQRLAEEKTALYDLLLLM